MELSWSESDMELEEFLKRFKLPQVVQIVDGTYGKDDETTLSRGQELNLHMLKELQFYSGLTDSHEEVLIPLNSQYKVNVFSEKEVKFSAIDDLCNLFPQKYRYIRLLESIKNPSNPTEILQNGTILETLYFEKHSQSLICLDNEGCEVALGVQMMAGNLGRVKALEKSENIFIGEVFHRFSLPVTVQFVQESSSKMLQRGFVDLKSVNKKYMVIATNRGKENKNLLTLPSSLDVTVVAPRQASGDNQEYRYHCEKVNSEMNLEEVEETADDCEEIYDEVNYQAVRVIPYAERFFSNRKSNEEKSRISASKTSAESFARDTEGYVSMVRECRYHSDSLVNHNPEPPPLPPRNCSEEGDSGSDSENYEEVDVWKPKSHSLKRSMTSKLKDQGLVRKFTQLRQKSKSDGLSPPNTSASSSLSDDVRMSSPAINKPTIYSDDDDDYEYPVIASPNKPLAENRYADSPKKNVMPTDKKVQELTIEEVGMLLCDLNLSQYERAFEEEQVDGQILVDLDKECLLSHFNMTSFHALKLLKAAMENWRPAVSR